jgi:hypothetical protein
MPIDYELPPLDSPEPYTRSHELDEELDGSFLEFLRSRGVTIIGCSANRPARTTIVKWVDPAGSRRRIDVSDFPGFDAAHRLITAPVILPDDFDY